MIGGRGLLGCRLEARIDPHVELGRFALLWHRRQCIYIVRAQCKLPAFGCGNRGLAVEMPGWITYAADTHGCDDPRKARCGQGGNRPRTLLRGDVYRVYRKMEFATA